MTPQKLGIRLPEAKFDDDLKVYGVIMDWAIFDRMKTKRVLTLSAFLNGHTNLYVQGGGGISIEANNSPGVNETAAAVVKLGQDCLPLSFRYTGDHILPETPALDAVNFYLLTNGKTYIREETLNNMENLKHTNWGRLYDRTHDLMTLLQTMISEESKRDQKSVFKAGSKQEEPSKPKR